MKTLDLKLQHSKLYKQSKDTISLVEVPELSFLMIDGEGDPNTSPSFKAAVEALFSLSYKLKFMAKKGKQQIDYPVMPLEGLWWAEDMSTFSVLEKENWKWTLMILQPDFISTDMVEQASKEVAEKKDVPALKNVRLEKMEEGLCAQILHLGPFSNEGPTIEKLHQYIFENGFALRGKHREIYLSDMRKAAPEKLKTIIRQPIEKR